MDTKLIELWEAGHLSSKEFFYLVDAVRVKQQLLITEIENNNLGASNERNN